MKMKYSIYRNQLDIFRSSSQGKSALRRIFGKNPVSFQDFLSMVTSRIPQDSEERINMGRLLSEEKLWDEYGSPIIFIESKALANDLFTAEFDFTTNFNIQPPFKSFALSFPNGTFVNGTELTSCLVTIMMKKEFTNLYAEKSNFMWGLSESTAPDELCINVHYQNKDHSHGSFFTHTSAITETLKKNAQEPLPKRSSDILDALTRIALSLCVYNSATEGEKLIDGYPQSAVKLPRGRNRVAYKGLTLHAPEQNKSAGESRKIKHRIPFYRNLRAKRYYQGKYKDQKPGTRWVLVKEVDTTNSMNTLLH
jgi:hypothetical protein